MDWFDFETRMRKLISQLMHPTLLKFNEDKENLAKLQVIVDLQRKRIDDLEELFLQNKKQNTHSQFDKIFIRLSEIVISLPY